MEVVDDIRLLKVLGGWGLAPSINNTTGASTRSSEEARAEGASREAGSPIT